MEPRVMRDETLTPACTKVVRTLIRMRKNVEDLRRPRGREGKAPPLKHIQPLLAGHQAIAEESGLSKQTVIDCLRQLVDRGILYRRPGSERIRCKRHRSGGRNWKREAPFEWDQFAGGREHAHSYYAAPEDASLEPVSGADTGIDTPAPLTPQQIAYRRQLKERAFAAGNHAQARAGPGR